MLQDKKTKRMSLYSDKDVPSCPNCGIKDSVWLIDKTGVNFNKDWEMSKKFRYSIFVTTISQSQEEIKSSTTHSKENGAEIPRIYFCSYCYEIGYKLHKLKE